MVVVAKATRSEPSPPNVAGDGPEKFVRLTVIRVLKEELADKMISIRTRDGEEAHVGKDWVVMLSADNVTKKHLFSSMLTTDVAAEVKTILAKKKK